jgi:hypothetical protein
MNGTSIAERLMADRRQLIIGCINPPLIVYDLAYFPIIKDPFLDPTNLVSDPQRRKLPESVL